MASSQTKYECPLFLKFLEESVKTGEGIKTIQEFFGYCLQRNEFFGRFLFLLNPGGSGKTVLAYLLREMLGDKNCSNLGIEDLGGLTARAGLEDKRVNICPVSDIRALVSPAFKSIVGGDLITAEDDDRGAFSFQCSCKFVVAANHLPMDVEKALDFERRALVVRFRYIPAQAYDLFLPERIGVELPGIREWARQGLNRLVKNNGFTGHCDRVPASEWFMPLERDYSIEGIF
ncbi:MAG: hypothetical protein KKC20_01840 [Proteobacteria bacterium]|nr:hypothetical protein [Pseudomonadota bacterium]